MHFRARSYDPRLGRFVQKEPILHERVAWTYTYASNRPTLGKDPWGTLSVIAESPSPVGAGIDHPENVSPNINPPSPASLQAPQPINVRRVENLTPAQQSQAVAAFQRAGNDASALLANVGIWKNNKAQAPASWHQFFGGPNFPNAHAGFWIDYERMLERLVAIARSGNVILKGEPAWGNVIAYVYKPYYFLWNIHDTIHLCPAFFQHPHRVTYRITEFPDTRGQQWYRVYASGTMFHEISHWAGTHDGYGDTHSSRFADTNAYSATHLAMRAGLLR